MKTETKPAPGLDSNAGGARPARRQASSFFSRFFSRAPPQRPLPERAPSQYSFAAVLGLAVGVAVLAWAACSKQEAFHPIQEWMSVVRVGETMTLTNPAFLLAYQVARAESLAPATYRLFFQVDTTSWAFAEPFERAAQLGQSFFIDKAGKRVLFIPQAFDAARQQAQIKFEAGYAP